MSLVKKNSPGRPKQYETSAERVAAFRENNKKQRYDVYLSSNAHEVLRIVMQQEKGSASKILDGILTKKIKLP